MRFILSIPLIAVVMVLYAAFAYTVPEINPDLSVGSVSFDATLPSDAGVFLTFGDIFVLLGLVMFFFEIVKAAKLGPGTIVDHVLSTIAFVIALVVFLLVQPFGTSSFLMLTVMAFIDVLAGFTVSIFSARRDYSVNGDGI